MLGNTAEAKLAVPLMCCAWMRRIASRKTTGGVSTTARAKLKVSARDFATPASIPAEMVAPEREQRYVQEHGSQAYQQLLRRLFDERFPPDSPKYRSEIKAVCAMPEDRTSRGDVALWCLAAVMALVLF